MFVKPAPGRAVPDPERGGLLGDAGRHVEPTQYWLRRQQDNDVIVVDEEETAPVQAPAQDIKAAKAKD
jgi:hypothetical protein